LLWLPGKCLITIIFRKYLIINYTLNKIYGQASELVHRISDAPNISLLPTYMSLTIIFLYDIGCKGYRRMEIG